MTKDVIYIDVEDDITTIVGKIKASKEKIIALVPPSRVGVLQSAVNMRLLQRTAEQAKKRVVLISNNQALTTLAATAKIPVAKNLQSKPEMPEVPVLKVDGDDIIDGEKLPVGELAKTSTSSKKADAAVAAVIKAGAVDTSDGSSGAKSGKSKGAKVPNFSTFRKKLLLIGGGVLLFIGFLVWAIWFAPRATVVITAKTTTVTVDKNVKLAAGGATDVKADVIKSIRQEKKRDLSVEFTATGKKKVGQEAAGAMKLTRTSISSTPLTVAAGTAFSSGDYTFVSTESATLAGTTVGPGGNIQDTATVRVKATSIGEEYNLSARGYVSNVGGFSAQGSAMTGGSSREVTVVSEDDVKRAAEKLSEQKTDDLRAELSGAFGGSSIVVKESYSEKNSEPSPSVAVDSEASGPVVLKSTITASMQAIDKTDLSQFLEKTIEAEIGGKKAQKVYSNGGDGVKFAQFTETDESTRVRITANGVVGPAIDEAAVKEQVRGKNYGDIQASLEAIEGVDDVDTKFWPFWVRTVPNDVKRITIEFKLQNAK